MLLGRHRSLEGLFPLARTHRFPLQRPRPSLRFPLRNLIDDPTMSSSAARKFPSVFDDSCWEMSSEELDSLEHTALAARKLVDSPQKNPPPPLINSPSLFRNSLANSPLKHHPRLLSKAVEHQLNPRSPPPPSKPSVKVRLYKDSSGKIALDAPYNYTLIPAYKSVTGYEWDPPGRRWLFPEQRLPDIIGAITSLPDLDVSIQADPPLVLPFSVPQILSSNSVLSPLNSPARSQERVSAPSTPSKETEVQIFLVDNDRIGARGHVHQNVTQIYRSVPGCFYIYEERMWTFPKNQLATLLDRLQGSSIPEIKINLVPPLTGPSGPSVLSEDRSFSFPSNQTPSPISKERPVHSTVRYSVKLYLHSCGLVAVKCQPTPGQKLVAVFKSISKAFWNPSEMAWMFPPCFLREAEMKLAAVDDVSCEVDSLEPFVRRALEFQSGVLDASDHYRNIPPHVEEHLLPFQREGVRFALSHGGRVLIADEMGLGKTVQGIAFASCFRDAWPVLVIVPSSLRLHWATMLKTWLKVPASDITVVLSQGSGSNREGFSVMQSAGKSSLELSGWFNIISYDMVSKLSKHSKFEVVIADESHFIKNAQAKRTSACVPLIQKSKYAVLLTGTPALSRPIELFTQLEALQPGVYSNVTEYGNRYCNGGYFGKFQGASNHEELHALLKSTVMIRRLKSEVLSQLPEKTREQVFLSLDMKDTKELRALMKELNQIRATIQNSADSAVEKLKREEQTLINKIYADSAVVKVPAVQDYLSTMLEANCKFLVFAHHHSMMDGIENHLKKKKVEYIRIDGETALSARHNLVTKFQESESVRAAVLSIRAAGVGITLTAASTVIFAEMSWTPGDLVQAEDRAHRLGQKSCVNIYYLHAQDTIDDFIWDAIDRKLGNLGQVLNGREEKLSVVSPSKLRQGNLNSYLRPCSRNLSEHYDQDTSGIDASHEKPVESEMHQTKRPRLSE